MHPTHKYRHITCAYAHVYIHARTCICTHSHVYSGLYIYTHTQAYIYRVHICSMCVQDSFEQHGRTAMLLEEDRKKKRSGPSMESYAGLNMSDEMFWKPSSKSTCARALPVLCAILQLHVSVDIRKGKDRNGGWEVCKKQWEDGTLDWRVSFMESFLRLGRLFVHSATYLIQMLHVLLHLKRIRSVLLELGGIICSITFKLKVVILFGIIRLP